jgi:hypothetical protein
LSLRLLTESTKHLSMKVIDSRAHLVQNKTPSSFTRASPFAFPSLRPVPRTTSKHRRLQRCTWLIVNPAFFLH